MIREIATGLVMDTSMPEGCVDLSPGRTPKQRVLTAGVATARGLLGTGTWGKLYDMLVDAPDGRYAVPELVSTAPSFVDADEVAELRRGLETVETGFFRICVHPPCILTASRMHGGYSLCDYHDDLLVAAEQGSATRG